MCYAWSNPIHPQYQPLLHLANLLLSSSRSVIAFLLPTTFIDLDNNLSSIYKAHPFLLLHSFIHSRDKLSTRSQKDHILFQSQKWSSKVSLEFLGLLGDGYILPIDAVLLSLPH